MNDFYSAGHKLSILDSRQYRNAVASGPCYQLSVRCKFGPTLPRYGTDVNPSWPINH